VATSTLRIIVDASTSGATSALASLGSVAGAAGKTVAAGWTAATAALVGTTASVFKTGVEFNTLSQRADAAFTTILGSAEAASAMMADITAFAKTSPFPRQAFITAAQQMAAFGIESQKIIPYLGNIQDAVAAAGGGSQQLSEVAFVMAQISSAGKITGQDLLQFGQRGINAADLIGSQMGKTGAEIRDAITKGTLGADQALDALSAGMGAKFGGAAGLVKETWTGATDRIKGAIRDIGSALAAPFVDPTGGGLAVGWANKFADALRALEGIVKTAMPILQEKFGGALAAVGPMLDKLTAGLKGVDVAGLIDKIMPLLPAIASITAGFAAMSGGLFADLPVIGPLLGGLSGPLGVVASAIGALIAFSPDLQFMLGNVMTDLMTVLQPLLPVISGLLTTVASAFGGIITTIAPLIPLLGLVVTQIVGALGPLVTALLPPLQAIIAAIVPVVGKLAVAFGGIVVALVPVITLVADVVAVLVEALAPIISSIFPILGDVIKSLVPVVGTLVVALGKIIAAVAPILPVLAGVIAQVVGGLAPVFVMLIQTLIPPLLSIITALMPIVEALGGVFALLIPPIAQIIGALLPPLIDILNLVIAAVAPLIPPVLDLVLALVNLAIKAIMPLLPILVTLLQSLIPILDPILKLIGPFADLLTAVTPLINKLGDLAAIIGGKLAEVLSTLIEGALSEIAPAFDIIADAIKWVIDKLEDFVKWLGKVKVPEWLSNAGSWVGGLFKASPAAFTVTSVGSSATSGTGSVRAPATSSSVVNVTVNAPFGGGDAIGRAIRDELLKMSRRRGGIVIGASA
jgi:tape measure domain-containing protein